MEMNSIKLDIKLHQVPHFVKVLKKKGDSLVIFFTVLLNGHII